MFVTPIEVDLLVLVLLLSLSAFFASSETALLSIGKAKVRGLAEANRPGAKLLLEIKSRPQKVLITILIANNLLNVSAAAIATALSLEFFPEDLGLAVATGAMTLLILVFGEITPKSVALRHSEFIALRAAPALNALSILFAPLIFVLDSVTSFVAGRFGGHIDNEFVTEEEVKAAASLSAEAGAILAEEKEMVHRIFMLNDIRVEQIMAPRSEIVALESGVLVKDVPGKIMAKHSRFPVYRGSLDNIVGVFHAKDYARSAIGTSGEIPVDKLMRKAVYVRADKTLDVVLRLFKEKKAQLAIAVGAKGDTLGVITLGDVMEALVGSTIAGN